MCEEENARLPDQPHEESQRGGPRAKCKLLYAYNMSQQRDAKPWFSVEWMENSLSVRGLQIDCMYVCVDVYVIWGLDSHLSSCSIRGTLHHHD